MKMEIKGPPHGLPTEDQSASALLTDADKVWDVVHNWNTQLQAITAVNDYLRNDKQPTTNNPLTTPPPGL